MNIQRYESTMIISDESGRFVFYADHQFELSALREDLTNWKTKACESAERESSLLEENERLKSESFEALYNAAIDERDALREEIEISRVAHHETSKIATAAEQRNSELVELLRETLPALALGASAFKSVKTVQLKVKSTLKPTESGASE